MGKNRYETVEEAAFELPGIVKGVTQRFLAAEKRFNNGDRSALFDTLVLCAQYQAVIPEWAADELLQGATDLKCGDCLDLNELMGWKDSPNERDRRREALIRAHEGDVIARLIAHRCKPDGSFNAELAFSPIAEETGLTRRIIQEIYQRSKQTLKNIRQGNPGGINHASVFAELPMLRRRGRSLL